MELLVVIAILGLLGAISIPVARMFGRNDLRDGARTLYTMLRAARMYAMTYNVEAAVVYTLDFDLPIEDSLKGGAVRAIRGAAVMYRAPDIMGLTPASLPDVDAAVQDIPWGGTFVPAPRVGGEFLTFPGDNGILLESVPTEWERSTPGVRIYGVDPNEAGLSIPARQYLAHYNRALEQPATRGHHDPFARANKPGLEHLGMMPVHVYSGIIYMEHDPQGNPRVQYEPRPDMLRPHMAHVFTPRGTLKTLEMKERYRILFAPTPNTYFEERVVTVGDFSEERIRAWAMGAITVSPPEEIFMLGIPVEIHRVTGRVRMGS